METKAFFPTSEKIQVEDYPYGRLRTTVWYSLEFKPKLGFRSVFQSKDPKTGRINKPKNGTYYPVLVYTRDENDHVKSKAFSFNGDADMKAGVEFMAAHFDLFTADQIKWVYGHIHMMLMVDCKATVVYRGASIEAIAPLYKPALAAAKKGYETGVNCFAECLPPFAEIDTHHVEGFNPFTVTTYGPAQ